MSATPHANGGELLRSLRLPEFRDRAVDVPTPGGATASATHVLGEWVREIIRANPDNFRLVGPDEVASNRLQAVFDVTDRQFPPTTPVIFAFHGYPWLIHRLTYRRANHDQLHVPGYTEEGTTTTPFDMLMLNDLDRFHLVADVIDRVPSLAVRHTALRQHMLDERLRCRDHTRATGEDAPDVRDWVWSTPAI